jgi:hypothetical protein
MYGIVGRAQRQQPAHTVFVVNRCVRYMFKQFQLTPRSKIFTYRGMEILHGPQPLPQSSIDSRILQPLANAIGQDWPYTAVSIFPHRHESQRHTSLIHHFQSYLPSHPPYKPTWQAHLKNTTRHDTPPRTAPFAHGPMAALSPSHTPHPISHDRTPHLHTLHPCTPLIARYHPHAPHTPRGVGSKNPQHPLERLDLGGSRYSHDL